MYDVLPTRTAGTGAGAAARRSEDEFRRADCSDRDETWVDTGVEQ
jgi:hypothetical protein